MRYLLHFTFLSSLLLTSHATAGDLKGRAEINARIGHERSIGMTEFWVPFAQESKKVLYGSFRMMSDNNENHEFNLGTGYREIINSKTLGNGVAGVHGWLDRRITERNSKFHQVTIGAEWLGENLDVRLNGYIPLNKYREINIANKNSNAPELAGTGILVDTNGTVLEEPQNGLDLELGLELGQYSKFIYDYTDRFHAYAGGYYFDGPNTEDVAGWRTRITTDITEDIQFGARFQRDNERGSQGFLEVTIRFPFGNKKSYRTEGIRARLDESPERDIDIVTNEVVTNTGNRVQVLNQVTGDAQEVLVVDNSVGGGGDGSSENPFNSLASAQAAASTHTIIYVRQGDGTSTNQDQGISLNKEGQKLIGSGVNFIYNDDNFKTASGKAPIGSLLIESATSAPIISNINADGDGITISADNTSVSGITVDGSTRDGIVIVANGAATSAENVTVQNVTTQNNRHGIYIHGRNDGAVSAMVQNVITTSNTQHGITVYDDTNGTFIADLGGGEMGSTGNNVLTGNTLEDLAVEYDGRALSAQNNWWGQASGPDEDDPTVGISPQIYYGAPINDGLIGHWTLDTEWTTDTIAYDRSGQGNNGNLQNLDLTNSLSAEKRQGLQLNGTDEYISIINESNFDLTNAITVYSNYRVDNFDLNNQAIVTKGDNAWRLTRQASNNFIQFHGDGTTPSIRENGNDNVNDSSYHSSTGTFDANVDTSILYVDAAVDATSTNINGSIQTNNFDVNIGRNSQTANRYFEGVIDDVRIYDRALDASEISELNRMNTSSTVNISGFLSSAP